MYRRSHDGGPDLGTTGRFPTPLHRPVGDRSSTGSARDQGTVGGPGYRRKPGTGPLAAEGRMQAKKWLYSGSSDPEGVPEASI